MKKTLSLLLVLVMAISVMTLAVSAENMAVAAGASETVSIAAGSSVNVDVDATAADVTVTVSGGRTFWDWNVQAGKQQFTPNPGGFAEISLPAGEVYTLVLNNTNTEAAGELTVTVEGPAEVGSEKNPAAAPWFDGASCWLMNTELAAGDEDGYWYVLTADKAGVLSVLTSCDAAYFVRVDQEEYMFQGVNSDGNPIITYPVAAGDQVKVFVSMEPDMNWEYPAGKVYVSAEILAGDEVEPIQVHSAVSFRVPVAAGGATCVADYTGSWEGKGMKISAWDAANTTVTIDGVNYTDTDGDGVIELTYPGNFGFRPAVKIINSNGGNKNYNVTICESASEAVCPSCKAAGKDSYVNYVAAKEATCHTDGNDQYWICPNVECNAMYADTERFMITDIKSVTKTMLGSENVEHIEAAAATCHTNGNLEHWVCGDCGVSFMDEACTRPVLSERYLIQPATGAVDIEHVEAVAATCHSNGNLEHWICGGCGVAFMDEACTQAVMNDRYLIQPATGAVDVAHVEGAEATCHMDGVQEHWVCGGCGYSFMDEACTQQVMNDRYLILPATGAVDVEHVEAKDPTCHLKGNQEYYTCGGCDGYFSDEACTQRIMMIRYLYIPATAEIEYVEAVEAGCHNMGNKEHWICTECKGVFADFDCTQEIMNDRYLIDAATGAVDVEHVEAVEATCHTNGNEEHWICGGCEGLFMDEACTQQVMNERYLIKPATGAVDVEHVEAVEATCHSNGNIEHWICADCGGAFTDEACTQEVMNERYLVIPATGVVKAEHFEEVAATCHGMGMQEHWVCADCGGLFTDEACTQQVMNERYLYIVELGSENIKHVKRVEPTTDKEGNVEYWYCSDCGGYYLDEACTQLTNAKSVIIAKVSTPVTGDNTSIVVLAAAMVISIMGIAAVVFTKKRNIA